MLPTHCPRLTLRAEVDHAELGKRVAVWLSNEAEGFGAWIDPAIFEVRMHLIPLRTLLSPRRLAS